MDVSIETHPRIVGSGVVTCHKINFAEPPKLGLVQQIITLYAKRVTVSQVCDLPI
jgi:hypothetical protein